MKLIARLATLTVGRPRRVSVRAAWLAHERYVGQRLRLRGVVRAFDDRATDPTAVVYYTLDDGPQRIGLAADAALLQPLVGRSVWAVGVLTFKPGVGIFLAVEQIAATR